MNGTAEKKSAHGIITTHLNADFDAIASCLAAKLLFPEFPVVLPGGMERVARRFLKENPSLLEILSPREIDTAAVQEIVIVDANQHGRLGLLANLIELPGIRIHLFDHHDPNQATIPAHKKNIKIAGANTTIMCQILKKRGITPTPEQATLLALGIYEDTGSFTFVSTTPEDLQAAAWLLGLGADLRAISQAMGSRFTPEHISLLNDLLDSAITYTFRGEEITIAKTSTVEYIDDFSVLAHELMEMAAKPAIFILGDMEDQIVVVGRSRSERINVGEILSRLGGGGHRVAASAVLKGVTLQEAENRLIDTLHSMFGTGPKVKDIMSYPVIAVQPDTPTYEVHDLIARYGISVVPVTDESGGITGYVTRNIVEKAVYHGIALQPISEFMNTDVTPVEPEDSLDRVRELITQGNQRFLPVVTDGKLIGIITRTDLLDVLSSDLATRPEKLLPSKVQKKNVAKLLQERLPQEIVGLLRIAGETAEELGYHVYVVGGFVRDLLLRQENLDIDLVVEGDGITFARIFAKKIGGRIKEHKRFKTAVLIIGKDSGLPGFKLDIATARFEYYEYPAAMPTVAESSIKLDLFRRDFTINTLAIQLNPDNFGMLIDFFGGQRDLKDGIVRVLHSLSFIDDPTRIFRAVRFEKRFGFRIGKHTLRLIKNSLKLGVIQRLSGKRVATELKHIMKEPEAAAIIERLNELGILRAISPSLQADRKVIERIKRVKEVLVWYDLLYRPEQPEGWLVGLSALFSKLTTEQRKEITERLGFQGEKRSFLIYGPVEAARLWKKLTSAVTEDGRQQLKNSDIYALLSHYTLEVQLLTMAWEQDSDIPKQIISSYITKLLKIRPEITGHELKEMGFEPGPLFRTILDRLNQARLNGEARSREDELRIIEKEFSPLLSAGENQKRKTGDKEKR